MSSLGLKNCVACAAVSRALADRQRQSIPFTPMSGKRESRYEFEGTRRSVGF